MHQRQFNTVFFTTLAALATPRDCLYSLTHTPSRTSPVIEIRRANKLKKLSSMMDKIDVYVCCDVPVSGHVSESMNNWTTSDKVRGAGGKYYQILEVPLHTHILILPPIQVSKDILKTQVFEDADEADFNRRLVIPVSEESLSSGELGASSSLSRWRSSAHRAPPLRLPLVTFCVRELHPECDDSDQMSGQHARPIA